MRRVSFVLVLALAAVSLSAQNPQNRPTFRSGAAYVRVDMYATRDGKPIEDIQENEVEILEDGVPQKIEAFEHVRVRTGIPQELRVEPNTVEQSRQMAGDPRARVFVIFLDTYHTQIEGSATMRQPLMNFIDRVLGPDDMVAVMTPEMAATEITFQRKTTVISRMLEREWLWGRRGRMPGADNDEKEDLYDACYPDAFQTVGIAKEMKARRREKLTLDALEDLMVHLNGIREERKAVLAVTEGWVIYRPDSKLARALDKDDPGIRPGDVLLRPPRPQPSDTGQVQGSPRVQCEADRMALAAARSRVPAAATHADRQSGQCHVLSRVRARPRGVRCADRSREAAIANPGCGESSQPSGDAAISRRRYGWHLGHQHQQHRRARCAGSWTICRRTT